MKASKKSYEHLLNDMCGTCNCEFIIAGKKYVGRYGTLLRKYDPIKFNMYYRQWFRDVYN